MPLTVTYTFALERKSGGPLASQTLFQWSSLKLGHHPHFRDMLEITQPTNSRAGIQIQTSLTPGSLLSSTMPC